MTCKNCEAKVEAALLALDEVDSAKADFLNSEVRLEGTADPMLVCRLIEEIGYSVHPKVEQEPNPDGTEALTSQGAVAGIPVKATSDIQTEPFSAPVDYFMAVEGMACAGCVATVEKILNDAPDTVQAVVNFAAETAWLQSTGDFEAMAEALAKSGYSVRLLDEDLSESEADVAGPQFNIWHQALIALLAGVLVMLWSMVFEQSGLGDARINLLLILGSAGIIAVSGGHYFKRAFAALRHGMATMDTLIALSTGAAWLYSSFALAPAVLLIEAPGGMIFYESAFFIIGFVNLGKAFERRVRLRAAGAVSALSELQPRSASRVLAEGTVENVPIENVAKNDILQVAPGARIPLDGILRAGHSAIDASLITGESELQPTRKGQSVIGGTLNVDDVIEIEVTKVGQATVMQQMIRDLKRAQNSKPALASRVDQVSAWFVPMVLVLAVSAALTWLLLGASPSFAVETMMTVLIIACPCALGLAVPMSIMVSVGRAAEAGLMIRNGRVLEAARAVTTVIFDKTGTLTVGQPEVSGHHWFLKSQNGTEAAHLAALRALLTRSEHVLSRAVVSFLGDASTGHSVMAPALEAGQGGSGQVDGRWFAFGRLSYLHDLGYAGGAEVDVAEGQSRVYWGTSGQVCGVFTLADAERASAAETIKTLHQLEKRVLMLTGDHASPAAALADALQLEFEAEVSPGQKQARVQSLQSSGAVVAMVGDGLNDAGALARADVSVAMAHGTEASIQAADLTLLSNDLNAVARLMTLSKQTVRNIHQNLVFAFLYNVTLIPVAAGLLYPSLGWRIDPSLAGLAMALSSVSVVINSARLSHRPLLATKYSA
jgi:P-type Cu+ transporter